MNEVTTSDSLSDDTEDVDPNDGLEAGTTDVVVNDTGDERVARLPGTRQMLIVSGPNVGTVVDSSTGEVLEPIPSRDDALTGRSPVMLVHYGQSCGQGVQPSVLARLHAALNGKIALGAVVDLPGRRAEATKGALESCTAASILIADPEGYRCTNQAITVNSPGPKQLSRATYLASGATNITEVLDAQRAAGANLLLTSGRAPNSTAAAAELELLGEEGDGALSQLQGSERLALNVTITDRWLTDDNLRRELLDFLLEAQQFDVWYVRVQYTASGRRSTEQPTNEKLIRGYKRLCELAEDEERILLLPSSGLTGWLSLAFGATGFGTGATGSKQAFGMPSTGGGANLPLERYLEPSFLHAVESTEHRRLLQEPTYTECTCPYCSTWQRQGAWNAALAGLHHVHVTGELTAQITTGKSRLSSVRQRVRKAKVASAAASLTGASEPKHLEVWDQVL